MTGVPQSYMYYLKQIIFILSVNNQPFSECLNPQNLNLLFESFSTSFISML
jgi:hypothetical protein